MIPIHVVGWSNHCLSHKNTPMNYEELILKGHKVSIYDYIGLHFIHATQKLNIDHMYVLGLKSCFKHFLVSRRKIKIYSYLILVFKIQHLHSHPKASI